MSLDALASFSDALASIVASVGPSLVTVSQGRARGTGTVFDADGTIVTNQHVFTSDEDFTVTVGDDTHAVTFVGRDPATDLLVLKLTTPTLPVPAWGTLDDARVGHVVLALGRPGRTVRASSGILGAVGGAWRTPGGTPVDHFLDVDASLPAGFGGGPLVDHRGRILGINSRILVRGTGAVIPTATVKRVVDALRTHGRIPRGYLGIGAQPALLPPALQSQFNQQSGLLLASIEPGGPAERAGLLFGDAIVALDGAPMRGLGDLRAKLTEKGVGSTVSAKVLRGGSLLDVNVEVGQRAA